MDPHNYIRVPTFIFLCLLFHSPTGTAAAKTPADLINDVCELSKSNQKFCLETLKANPQTATVKDHKGLAEIALAMTRDMSKKLARNSKIFSRKHVATRQATDQCATYFDQTIGMLNLNGLDGGTASLDVHNAYDNAQFCENALNKVGFEFAAIAPALQNWRNSFTIAISAVTTAEGDVAPEY